MGGQCAVAVVLIVVTPILDGIDFVHVLDRTRIIIPINDTLFPKSIEKFWFIKEPIPQNVINPCSEELIITR